MTAEDRRCLEEIKRRRGEYESGYIGYEWLLLSMLEAAENELAEMRTWRQKLADTCDELRAELDELLAERDKLRALLREVREALRHASRDLHYEPSILLRNGTINLVDTTLARLDAALGEKL